MTTSSLKDRVAIVTGAASGLGLATARRTLHGRLEILRSRAGKPNATFAAAVEADHEERLVKALLAGIAEPRVRLESLGFVVLAGTPLDV